MNNIIQQLKDANAEQNTAKILNLLPEICKAIDDGLIIELPCKVGTPVYHIVTDAGEYGNYMHVDFINFREDMIRCIGKTVFLTRPEAERRLESEKK